MKNLLTISLCFLLLASTQAQNKYVDFNDQCKSLYDEILKLKIPAAEKQLAAQKAANPNNLAYVLLEDYIDFFNIFIKEDEKLYHQLKPNLDKRISLVNQLANNDPWKDYLKAELYVHWAINRGKFEEYVTAVWDARKSFKLLESNTEKFPEFEPNKKTLGFMHAILGTIPDKYKLGMRLMGLNGSIENGMAEMEAYKDYSLQHNLFDDESLLMHTFFLVYLDNEFDEAWQIVSTTLNPTENLLHSFLVADIAYRTGRGDEAIEVMEQRPTGEGFIDYYFMDYFLGLLKLNRLDDDAAPHIEKFLNYSDSRHYIKEAWQRLAYTKLIKGDTLGFFNNLANCLTHGQKLMDADKQAFKDATNKTLPHVGLLKARLLNDGGYNEKALVELNALNQTYLIWKDECEWHYRKGRVYEALGRNEEAISSYEIAIRLTGNKELYYAGKAYLQIGQIYEKQEQIENAKSAYQKVFDYDQHPYKDSFEQQAKAALNRLQ